MCFHRPHAVPFLTCHSLARRRAGTEKGERASDKVGNPFHIQTLLFQSNDTDIFPLWKATLLRWQRPSIYELFDSILHFREKVTTT